MPQNGNDLHNLEQRVGAIEQAMQVVKQEMATLRENGKSTAGELFKVNQAMSQLNDHLSRQDTSHRELIEALTGDVQPGAPLGIYARMANVEQVLSRRRENGVAVIPAIVGAGCGAAFAALGWFMSRIMHG
jgi:hypothetical protein